MSSDNDSGLMSNAGLVRYFDEEASEQVFTEPQTVIFVGLLLGALGIALNVAV